MGLPAGLGDTWNLARECKLAEADSTERETADVRPRPATELTAIVLLRFEAGRTLRFDDERLFGHCGLWPPV